MRRCHYRNVPAFALGRSIGVILPVAAFGRHLMGLGDAIARCQNILSADSERGDDACADQDKAKWITLYHIALRELVHCD
jgi:hypothetical protein